MIGHALPRLSFTEKGKERGLGGSTVEDILANWMWNPLGLMARAPLAIFGIS